MTERRNNDSRSRLLNAAARLISESPGQDVPLRAICEEVGVKLPTLYHFFGSKEGLLDAVIEHGFETYVAAKYAAEPSGDPVEDLRRGWDAHVDFGLANPGFYALMYGQVTPHRRPAAAAGPYAALLDLCVRAHREHRLVLPPEQAADEVLAANVGVTLFLITSAAPDLTLSAHARDAVFAHLTGTSGDTGRDDAQQLARRLLVRLPDDTQAMVPEETALLRRWLALLAAD